MIKTHAFIESTEVNGLSYKPFYHATGNWDQMDVAFTCLTKFDSDVQYPKLRLLGPVEYFIVNGEIVINDDLCREGDYVRIENGNVRGRATNNGCVVLCVYHKGLEIL